MKKFWIIVLIIILINITIGLSNILISAIKQRENFSIWNKAEIEKKTDNIVKKESINLDNIENLNINIKSSCVKLILTQDENMTVIQYSNKKLDEKEIVKVNKDNTNVQISEQKQRVWNRIFMFNTYHISYDIYIPQNYKNNLHIESESGDIDFENEFEELNAKNMEVETISGNITLKNNVEAEKIKLKSTSGDIETKDIKSTNTEINTISGNIDSKAVTGSLKAKSTSGDIEIQRLIGNANIKTTSGEVSINDFIILNESSIASISGDIKVYLNKESNCNISTKTTSGDVMLPDGMNLIGNEPYNTLKIETVSGDVNIK